MQTTFSHRLGLAAALAAFVLLPACSFIVAEDSVCGDGKVTGPEECDGWLFTDTTCESLGFSGGHLVCNIFCRIETFNCHLYECGDEHCDPAESPEWCPQDCTRSVACPDGYCDPSEADELNPDAYCPSDCSDVHCGDGVCQPPAENDETCPLDCASASYCGDGICQLWEQGDHRCDEDCLDTGPECGNGTCEGNEPSTCPQDCQQSCNHNSTCEPDQGETAAGCEDCSACQDDSVCRANLGEVVNHCPDCMDLPDCGDGTCGGAGDETAANCPTDCSVGVCSDGVVNAGEACDGDDFLSGPSCAGKPAHGGYDYTSGDLICNQDCSVSSFGCYPRDLGASCATVSDCWQITDIECVNDGTDAGLCTIPCMGDGTCTTYAPGTECFNPGLASPFDVALCLRPCDFDTCPSGLNCLDFQPTGSYCLP